MDFSNELLKLIGEQEVYLETTDSGSKVICLPRHNLKIWCVDFNVDYDHATRQDRGRMNRWKNDAWENGVETIIIYESEWVQSAPIVKSRILHILNRSTSHLYARSLTIKHLEPTEARDFFRVSHIQGSLGSSVRMGLVNDNGDIQIAASWGKPRFNKKATWELVRLASALDTSVAGGASRLFSEFRKTVCSPNDTILSYCDRRWSRGRGTYLKAGFEFTGCSDPCYWYINPDRTLSHRVRFQKHKLKGLLPNFDPALTEIENMRRAGYRRIFDCGTDVFVSKYCPD